MKEFDFACTDARFEAYFQAYLTQKIWFAECCMALLLVGHVFTKSSLTGFGEHLHAIPPSPAEILQRTSFFAVHCTRENKKRLFLHPVCISYNRVK